MSNLAFSSPIFGVGTLKFINSGWNIWGQGCSTAIYIFSLGERVWWDQNMSFRVVEGLIKEFGREVEIVGVETKAINCTCFINTPKPCYHQQDCPIRAICYGGHPQKVKIKNKKGEEHEFTGAHFFPLKD